MKTLIAALLLLSSVAEAHFSVSPSYLNFGNVEVGSTSYGGTVFVTNWSKEQENIRVSGYCADFDVTNYSCYYVPPNGSCTIGVSMRPTTEGAKFCSVWLNGYYGSGSIQLSGNGVKRD